MSHSHSPTADVSVRPGIESDARAIAAIQAAAWRASYAQTMPAQALASLDVDAMAASWHSALTRPPTAMHRLLIACAGPVVVGFAALVPDPDKPGTGEVVALEIAPARRREGHGSRLLAACADTLIGTRSQAIRAWALQGDEIRGQFLSSAGLATTGTQRVLDVLGTGLVEQEWGARLG